MTSTSRPPFVELWKQYLDAFNRFSYPEVRACISSDCEFWFRGKLLQKNDWDHVENNYRGHWALPGCVVTIHTIEECDDGVLTELVDHARGKLLTIKYFYALEGDKWLQVKHDIKDAVDWNPEEKKST